MSESSTQQTDKFTETNYESNQICDLCRDWNLGTCDKCKEEFKDGN